MKHKVRCLLLLLIIPLLIIGCQPNAADTEPAPTSVPAVIPTDIPIINPTDTPIPASVDPSPTEEPEPHPTAESQLTTEQQPTETPAEQLSEPQTFEPIKVKKIVAFGDSLTEGLGVDPEDSYPSQLERKFQNNGYDIEVVNMGVSSETTFDALERINEVVAEEPELVIITIGANDGFKLYKPKVIRMNIEDMIRILHNNDIMVVLGGMRVIGEIDVDIAIQQIKEDYGVSDGIAAMIYQSLNYAENFRTLYPGAAQELNVPLIPVFLEGVAGNPDLNIEDGLHPNKEGYTVIVEQNIWPVLEPLIEKS